MSNILQEIVKKFYQLFPSIYQYKVVNIVLLNSSLCMSYKKHKAHIQFSNFKFKIILKCRQTLF